MLYLILAIAAGFIAIHLSLVERIGNPQQMGTFLVCWSVVALTVWNKYHPSKHNDLTLYRNKDGQNSHSHLLKALAMGVGLLLIPILVKSFTIQRYETNILLDLMPLLIALGIGFLGVGFGRLRDYWRELLILGLPGIVGGLAYRLINPSTLSAKFSTILLLSSGFNVSNNGVYITYYPNSLDASLFYRIEVNHGCSGIGVIL